MMLWYISPCSAICDSWINMLLFCIIASYCAINQWCSVISSCYVMNYGGVGGGRIKFWLNFNQVCVHILNNFHFGNFLNEFHHVLQFLVGFYNCSDISQCFTVMVWLDCIYIYPDDGIFNKFSNQPTNQPTHQRARFKRCYRI